MGRAVTAGSCALRGGGGTSHGVFSPPRLPQPPNPGLSLVPTQSQLRTEGSIAGFLPPVPWPRGAFFWDAESVVSARIHPVPTLELTLPGSPEASGPEHKHKPVCLLQGCLVKLVLILAGQ